MVNWHPRKRKTQFGTSTNTSRYEKSSFFQTNFVAESNVTATYAVNLNRNLRMLLNPPSFHRNVPTSSRWDLERW